MTHFENHPSPLPFLHDPSLLRPFNFVPASILFFSFHPYMHLFFLYFPLIYPRFHIPTFFSHSLISPSPYTFSSLPLSFSLLYPYLSFLPSPHFIPFCLSPPPTNSFLFLYCPFLLPQLQTLSLTSSAPPFLPNPISVPFSPSPSPFSQTLSLSFTPLSPPSFPHHFQTLSIPPLPFLPPPPFQILIHPSSEAAILGRVNPRDY